MTVLKISGGAPLKGEIPVSGAKNAALPIIAAATAVKGEVTLTNCPRITDVETSINIIEALGGKAAHKENTLTIDCTNLTSAEVPDVLAKKMRSSLTFCGPLLARTGEVAFTKPGGCILGSRPIDLHLKGFKAMGAGIYEENDKIIMKGKLHGAEIPLSFPSVGATQSLMAAACLARGKTTIINPSKEPETFALADFLLSCGARIGFTNSSIEIEGVEELFPTEREVIPDRIEAGTYLCAAALTGGKITLRGITIPTLGIIAPTLQKTGCILTEAENSVTLTAPPRPLPIEKTIVRPYPAFPTDLQPQLCALLSVATGKSEIKETVFEARNRHIPELRKMGAKIEETDSFLITGVSRLRPAELVAYDLRGGAALLIAALAAKGVSSLKNPEHIFRGYENILGKITALNGKVEIVENAH